MVRCDASPGLYIWLLQVIFCSRTHSQLSQFVGELKRTKLAEMFSLVALASRQVKPVSLTFLLQILAGSSVVARPFEQQVMKRHPRDQFLVRA